MEGFNDVLFQMGQTGVTIGTKSTRLPLLCLYSFLDIFSALVLFKPSVSIVFMKVN